MKTHDLNTEQGRKAAIEEIEQSFIKSLREIGGELSEDTVVNVRESMITIGLKAIGTESERGMMVAFASEVDLYAKKQGILGERKNQISFGSIGSFDNTQREAYWRTIHAASILKNWGKVCETVNEHCKRYSELEEEINKQSPNNHENT
jgi:molybdopterin converting factor small subunit